MAETEFLKNERPNEYEARFRVEGDLFVSIEADSLDEAKAKAAAMLDDEEAMLELDAITDARVDHVWKSPTMFLVNRGGSVMQVSRLQDGDIPRQPDDRGF